MINLRRYSVLVIACLLLFLLPAAFAEEQEILAAPVDEVAAEEEIIIGEMNPEADVVADAQESSDEAVQDTGEEFYIKDGVLEKYTGSGGDVVIPEGVTEVFNFAFSDRDDVVSVHFPNSLTKIGDYAFKNCNGLTYINIPNNVTEIVFRAFTGCKNLETVILSESLDCINDETFYGCESLSSIVIPENVQVIEAKAFYGCESLSSIIIPKNVQVIEEMAFAGCTNLKSVTVLGTQMISRRHRFNEDTDVRNVFANCSPELTVYTLCDTPATQWAEYMSKIKVEPSEHESVVIPAVPATETTHGLTEGSYCAVCGKKLISQEVSHYPVTIPAVPSTCSINGSTEGSKCAVCGAIIVPPKKTATAPHTLVIDPAVPSTCKKRGLTEGSHCAVCGFVFSYRMPAELAPHTPYVSKPAVPPTCSTLGWTERKDCSICGITVEESKSIACLPHTPVIDLAVASTCIEKGLTEGSHCAVCDKVLVKQTATPLAAHTPIADPDVAATCTEKGFTGGSHCAVCRAVLEQPKSTPLAPHTPVTDPKVEPSYAHTGLTEGAHCEVCGAVLKEQREIPALTVKSGQYWLKSNESETLNVTNKLKIVVSDRNIVECTSDNPSIAKASNSGLITAKKKGKTIVSVKTDAGDLWKLKITVKDPAKLSTKNLKLDIGKSDELTIKHDPGRFVKWSSSDNKIAKVYSTGKVKAFLPGTCTITATFSNGDTLKSKVTVRDTASFSEKSVSVGRGYTKKLSIVDLYKRKVTWKTSDKSVVDIVSTDSKSATVKGKKKGSATITAIITNGVTITCKVNVVDPMTIELGTIYEESIYNSATVFFTNNTNKRIVYVKFNITQYNNRGDKLRSPYSFYYCNDDIPAGNEIYRYYYVNDDTKSAKLRLTEVTFSDGSKWRP